ncbi:Subtilase family protein [Forsythia ovata]|uniref:Subtilase family protein n=1 Tax=Forsythia ovata TaxID=205694 RepID=A0ABD1SQP2_9LAMI
MSISDEIGRTFDVVVTDGIDIISLSIDGVVVPYYLDVIAIEALDASDTGIFVSALPGELTVTNVVPWVTTVGAGNIDRDFPTNIKLGNENIISGVSVYGGPGLAPFSLAFFGDI